jgi:hypothetical protein
MPNVTNLRERVHPGKVILAREMRGTGAPTTDTRLADNNLYPVGSTYLDEATNKLYIKKPNFVWQQIDVS